VCTINHQWCTPALPSGRVTVCVFSQNTCVFTSQDLCHFLHLDAIPPKIRITDDDRKMFVSLCGADLFDGIARSVQGLVPRRAVSETQGSAMSVQTMHPIRQMQAYEHQSGSCAELWYRAYCACANIVCNTLNLSFLLDGGLPY
jgi:hypothetical protein